MDLTIPNADAAEIEVMGAVFVDPNAWDRVRTLLRPSHFYRKGFATLWSILHGMDSDGLDVRDLVALHERIKMLPEAEGRDAFDAMVLASTQRGGSISNLEHYARLVVAAESQRRAWHAADSIVRALSAGQGMPSEALRELTQAAEAPEPDLTRHLGLSRFLGPPPGRKWLVRDIFERGKVSLFAAKGGVGKGTTLLRLALQIAAQSGDFAGNPIIHGGDVIVLVGEDDGDEMHRRLWKVDRDFGRVADRVHIVSAPEEAEPLILFQQQGGAYQPTKHYAMLRSLARKVRPAAIIIDPLSQFAGVNIDEDVLAGTYVMSSLGILARETGASIIIAHHMRKGDITDVDSARSAIRGTSALESAVRCAYCMWALPESGDEAQRIAQALNVEPRRGRFVRGAVVKANHETDQRLHLFVRNDDGLLEDYTDRDPTRVYSDPAPVLERWIRTQWAKGHPATRTGKGGVFARREELPPELQALSRDALDRAVGALIRDGRIEVGRKGLLRAAGQDDA